MHPLIPLNIVFLMFFARIDSLPIGTDRRDETKTDVKNAGPPSKGSAFFD